MVFNITSLTNTPLFLSSSRRPSLLKSMTTGPSAEGKTATKRISLEKLRQQRVVSGQRCLSPRRER